MANHSAPEYLRALTIAHLSSAVASRQPDMMHYGDLCLPFQAPHLAPTHDSHFRYDYPSQPKGFPNLLDCTMLAPPHVQTIDHRVRSHPPIAQPSLNSGYMRRSDIDPSANTSMGGQRFFRGDPIAYAHAEESTHTERMLPLSFDAHPYSHSSLTARPVVSIQDPAVVSHMMSLSSPLMPYNMDYACSHSLTPRHLPSAYIDSPSDIASSPCPPHKTTEPAQLTSRAHHLKPPRQLTHSTNADPVRLSGPGIANYERSQFRSFARCSIAPPFATSGLPKPEPMDDFSPRVQGISLSARSKTQRPAMPANTSSSPDIASSPCPPYRPDPPQRPSIQTTVQKAPAGAITNLQPPQVKADASSRRKPGPKPKFTVKTEPSCAADVALSPKAPSSAAASLPKPVLTPAQLCDLSLIWAADPRVPSVTSRAAWADARGIAKSRVHAWFTKQRRIEAKNGKECEGSYELAVDAPRPDGVEVRGGVGEGTHISQPNRTSRKNGFSIPEKRSYVAPSTPLPLLDSGALPATGCKRPSNFATPSEREASSSTACNSKSNSHKRRKLAQSSSLSITPPLDVQKSSINQDVECPQSRARHRAKADSQVTPPVPALASESSDKHVPSSAADGKFDTAKAITGNCIAAASVSRQKQGAVGPALASSNSPLKGKDAKRRGAGLVSPGPVSPQSMSAQPQSSTLDHTHDAVLPSIHPLLESKVDDGTADITFLLPSESWERLSSMPLLMRWETEALTECLAVPPTSSSLSETMKTLTGVPAVDEDAEMALSRGLDNMEFTPDELAMMAQMNEELVF